MSSLVGNSILHIANRLGDLQKKDNIQEEMVEGEMDVHREESPSTPREIEQEQNEQTAGILKFKLFKDSNNSYTTVPSTSIAEEENIAEEEKMESEEKIPETPEKSMTPPPSNLQFPVVFDFSAAFSQMQQHLANQQLTMTDSTPSTASANDSLMTMKDLLPGYSPWLRNAGRKKSHPVWEFFKDLKDTNGVGGVICLHCNWTGDDRSPNNLRTHLKKFHTTDGIFARFSQKLAQTPTQPYVKRARASNQQQSSMQSANDSMTLALQQLQNAAQQQHMPMTLNFLDNLPKSSEVINISAGFAPQEDDESVENANEPGSSGASASGERAVSNSPLEETSGGSPSVSSTNQLNAFMNMAANPLMWNAMLANQSHGSAFTINDGQCVSVLMKMAIDLDLTMSYHKRRGEIELCFESNRTAEKSGGRGKVLCMSDLGREIRVVERVNGTPTDTELWTKTDFNQFHWAIRGKCQKALVKA